MNSYTKILMTTVGALLATKTEASGLHNSCLSLSDRTIGQPEFPQQFITNEASLTSDSVTPDMRLDGFTVCTDSDDNITALQLFLSDTPYLGEGYARLLKLDPIGTMTGDCRGLRFTGPVTAMKAASKRNNGLQGIAFEYDGKVAEVGKMKGWKVNTETWNFNEENALMGLYGQASPNGVEKLGAVSLDMTCQAVKDAEEAARAAAEAEESTSVLTQVETNETEEEVGPLGLALFTWAIIVVGFVSFCLILNLTICALRKGFRAKGEIAVTTVETVAPVQKKNRKNNRKVANDIENNIKTEGGKKQAEPSRYPELN